MYLCVCVPDKEEDSEAPGVHSEAVSGGGRMGENFRGEVRRSPTQCPHQHSLLQDPGLVEVCHLSQRRRKRSRKRRRRIFELPKVQQLFCRMW